MRQIRQVGADLLHLVHLLLVARDDHARAAVAQHVGQLLADRVLVERHRHRAHRLRGDHRPIEVRAVAPDHRDVVAGPDPERQQPQRQRLDLGLGLGPGPFLPDAELLLPVGGAGGEARGVARQGRGDRGGGVLGRGRRGGCGGVRGSRRGGTGRGGRHVGFPPLVEAAPITAPRRALSRPAAAGRMRGGAGGVKPFEGGPRAAAFPFAAGAKGLAARRRRGRPATGRDALRRTRPRPEADRRLIGRSAPP